ncbi:MAG: hypothetical protein AB7I27_17545 [Bacteriovoracaceae bacterium]
MLTTWIKQFLVASGLFFGMATIGLVSFSVKEKKMASKLLEEAERTVIVSSESHFNLN